MASADAMQSAPYPPGLGIISIVSVIPDRTRHPHTLQKRAAGFAPAALKHGSAVGCSAAGSCVHADVGITDHFWSVADLPNGIARPLN